VWGVRASRTATTKDYLEPLADLRLPGPPVMVIADDDKAIGAAVRKMWPARKGPAPFLFACEHHLRARAKDALKEDKAATGRGRWMRRLDTAFLRPEGWKEFSLAASDLTHAAARVKANNTSVTAQVGRRPLLPAHTRTPARKAPRPPCVTCSSTVRSPCATPGAPTCCSGSHACT
jgi:hypothetical protein